MIKTVSVATTIDEHAAGLLVLRRPHLAASLLRLDDHPEVGVCFRCVDSLGTRKRTIERMTRAAPGPWRRRLQYRRSSALLGHIAVTVG